jgi:uncharacterized protein (TIGR02246 family)
MKKFILLMSVFCCSFANVYSLSSQDSQAIHGILDGIKNSWNNNAGKGFADNYTEDADFVNIFGMHFSGKEEIESRHLAILDNFLKGSTFENLDIKLREVRPDLVIAIVKWNVNGFRTPLHRNETNAESSRKGLFTHVLVKEGQNWKIVASQNTLQGMSKL